MTIQDLKDKKLIIFECVTGSQLYNLSTPTSDVDIKGCYILPLDNILGNKIVDQVSDEKNDKNYYDIQKFIFLLKNGNPNMLELLSVPEHLILYKHPIFDMILEHKEKFITKKCCDSFIGFAKSQVSKSFGLKKKIFNPIDKKIKSPLDFCYAYSDYDAIPLKKLLDDRGLKNKFCGVANLDHSRDMVCLYYDFNAHNRFEGSTDKLYFVDGEIKKSEFISGEYEFFKDKCMNGGMFLNYKGIVKEDENGDFISNELRMSSIPKEERKNMLTYFSYNKDGYKTYMSDYKEYFSWIENRNQARYQNNIEHGKNYDSKNLYHTIRLLKMGIEISEGKGIIPFRTTDREELLNIRYGKREYDDIIAEAEEKIKIIDKKFAKSSLPESVSDEFVYNLLIDIRKKFYNL